MVIPEKCLTFAKNCEDGLHLSKEQVLCIRFAPSLAVSYKNTTK